MPITAHERAESPLDQEEIPQSRDRYSVSYTLWTAAVFLWVQLGNDLDRIFRLWLLLVPVIGVPALVWAATLLIALGINAYKRRWRRVTSIIAAPIIAGSFFYTLGVFGVSTEWIRFELWRSEYLAQAKEVSAVGPPPHLNVWDWGSTGGAAVANVFYWLVYDDSGLIAKAPSSWSAEWMQNANKAAAGNGFYSVIHMEKYDLVPDAYDRHIRVTHIDGHFYLVVGTW